MEAAIGDEAHVARQRERYAARRGHSRQRLDPRERFAAEGWRVIITGRREDRLRELAAAHKDTMLPLAFDVSDRQAVSRAFASLPPDFAAIDMLVNNAGLSLDLSPAQICDLDDWDTMIDTNVKGLTYCTRAILPGMVARGRGHVINIGSIAGSYAYPGGNVYGGTKAFVEQFSRNLRCDLHGTGVRVTNVEPGLLETEFSLVRFKGDAARADAVYEGAEPLRPEDIAEIIWWVGARPAHVNICRVEVMPTCQSNVGPRVYKGQ
jgi:3-hydroxy acid dehydrogenase/malonic semialdehyde reductase